MQSRSCHETVGEEQYYIDKTEELEKGIVVFPSIYIEGAAATGKTTAVKMLLARYPEVEQKLVWMDREVRDIGAFLEYLDKIKSQLQEKATWIIFENIPADLPEEIQTTIGNSGGTRKTGKEIPGINVEEKARTLFTKTACIDERGNR